jgi:hypothetical protein
MRLGAIGAVGYRIAGQGPGLNAQSSGQTAPPRPPYMPPDVPNRTKVVRLIVVPESVDPMNANAVRVFAMAQSAAKADVFIVKDKATGAWHPRSWLGNALVDHDVAVRTDRESVVVAMIWDREQIQWESSVEFGITRIEKKADIKETDLINRGPSPDDPFEGRVRSQVGRAGQPIRSGPPTLNGAGANFNSDRSYDQLYKITFRMVIEGREYIIDPDVYCDWG